MANNNIAIQNAWHDAPEVGHIGQGNVDRIDTEPGCADTIAARDLFVQNNPKACQIKQDIIDRGRNSQDPDSTDRKPRQGDQARCGESTVITIDLRR